MKNMNIFEWIAHKATAFTGTTAALMTALALIFVWAITGPIFNFSNTWQLVINTGTTIVTFLMVFLIQRAQNKDSKAMHLKLNELVASLKGTSNRLIDVEDSSEAETGNPFQILCRISQTGQEGRRHFRITFNRRSTGIASGEGGGCGSRRERRSEG